MKFFYWKVHYTCFQSLHLVMSPWLSRIYRPFVCKTFPHKNSNQKAEKTERFLHSWKFCWRRRLRKNRIYRYHHTQRDDTHHGHWPSCFLALTLRTFSSASLTRPVLPIGFSFLIHENMGRENVNELSGFSWARLSTERFSPPFQISFQLTHLCYGNNSF